MMKKVVMLFLAIAIIATSFAMASVSTPIRTGGNGEGVNATVLGIFVVLHEDPRFEPTLYVDAVIDTNFGGKLGNVPMMLYGGKRSVERSDLVSLKIVDTNDVIHDMGSTSNIIAFDSDKLNHSRYIFTLSTPVKMKHLRFEVSKMNSTSFGWIAQTPFLVGVNETPDIAMPYPNWDIYTKDVLNAIPSFTINNISITSEKIYLTSEYPHCTVGWVLGLKLENQGSKPQLVNYKDFEFEDQYGWKYRPRGFTSYDPIENYQGNNIFRINRQPDELNLLPREALRVGLMFESISAISMPHTLEYMNQSMKFENVTAL